MSLSVPAHLRVGVLSTIPHDGGPVIQEDVVCCIHCGYMWTPQPGSGKIRGFCMTCNGFLCGRKHCRERVPCRHWRHGIDAVERGGSIDDPKPISVSVPALILGS